MNRRELLGVSMGAALGWRTAAAASPLRQDKKPIRAVLFDAFPLFDPRVVSSLVQRLYPEKAAMLLQAWRARQFEYQWLRVLGNRYVDFLQATEDSLTYAARQSEVALTAENRRQLMSAYSSPRVWPDTHEILPKIRDLGVSLGILSNMTYAALESGLTKANLRHLFSHILSTDIVRTYKPARRAYQLGTDSLGIGRDEVLMVAFAGWDVA
ncbi:MAG TPA: haloacid dehalogenase type II, partial [Steroidobacteraceae bacterium]|nr:haloacid dehalogenase type II [Steroidobacteraceae bacterium]